MPDNGAYVNERSMSARARPADHLHMETISQARIDALEERAVPGDPLAPFRLPDGTLDVDALELGQPAPTTHLERPAPFTTIIDGRRQVPATVRDARRRAAQAAEHNPPPIPGVEDRGTLRALAAAPAPVWTLGDVVDGALILVAIAAALGVLVALAAMATS